jgi:hypothetical protein
MCYYYLTPATKKTVQTSVNGFSKENRFIGGQLSTAWVNKNAFKGAELLSIRAYAGFELSFDDTLKNSNNYRIGGGSIRLAYRGLFSLSEK